MLNNFGFQRLIENYFIPWGLNILFALAIFIAGRALSQLIVKIVKKALIRAKFEHMLVEFLGSILNSLFFLIVAIIALNKLGVDTTSLIALIGAAGLAVGLALKDSLQNFASGVLLIVFRPFKVGHFVEAAGISGTIERIGIFSTLFKTVDNKEIIVPNGKIYSGVITNYSARPTRRIDLVISVSYEDDIRLAKSLLEKLLKEDERVLSEPEPFVAVGELADSGVNFVVRPWVNSGDLWAVKCDMLERIKLAFDEAGITIPYPQMDVHMTSNAS